MATGRMPRSTRVSSVMYLIAAWVFLLTALLSDIGGKAGFIILAMVFVVLSLNAWHDSRSQSG